MTDNGIQFADQPWNRNGWTAKSRVHRFDMICNANEIEHRLTKLNHPWTNGQVERMNRTIKEGEAEHDMVQWTMSPLNVKRYFYDDHDQLRRHLNLFVDTHNHARRLKTLKGLTPAQFISKQWQDKPEIFYEEPCHLTLGRYRLRSKSILKCYKDKITAGNELKIG